MFVAYAEDARNDFDDECTCSNNEINGTYEVVDTSSNVSSVNIYNFITPNCDGYNDVFLMQFKNTTDYSIEIYDNAQSNHEPDGNLVFQSTNYNNDFAFDNLKDGKYLLKVELNNDILYHDLYVYRGCEDLKNKSIKALEDAMLKELFNENDPLLLF